MDVSQEPLVRMAWADLAFLLSYTKDPKLRETYADFGPKWKILGGTIPINTTDYGSKGLVRSFKLFPGYNAVNQGVTSADSPLPDPSRQPGYTNILLNDNHISDTATSIMIEDRVKTLVKQGKDGVAQAAAVLQTRANEDLAHLWSLLQHVGREGIVGRLSSDPGTVDGSSGIGSIYDDTAKSCFLLYLCCGAHDLFMPAFLPGVSLQVGAAPSFGSPVTTLRNFTAPITVIGDFEQGYSAGTTSYLRVLCACPYTAATKTSIQTQLQAIASTDVVGLWAGATASTTDMPTGGFNHGFLGRRFWTETSSVAALTAGNFQDVEDVGGAIASTSPLRTDEDTQRSVDRNATSGEWSFLNPIVIEGGGAAMSNTVIGYLDNVFLQYWARTGQPVQAAILANPLVHRAMRLTLGYANITHNASALALAETLKVNFGVSAFVYQGESGQPIVVGQHIAVHPDELLIVRDGGKSLFEMLVPEPPEWHGVDMGLPLWSQRYNSSGSPLASFRATYKQSGQMFPVNMLKDSLAVIRNITPGTA